ncbi:MAG: 6-phospho-3-hexuloisomerase [Caldilineaceae bacterium]
MSQPLPEVVSHILEEIKSSLLQVDSSKLEALLTLLESSPRTFVTGEGRSGLVMRMFAMRLTHLGRPAFVVGDVTTPAIGAGDLLVVCSGSGETTIPCLRAQRSRNLGAQVIAIGGRDRSTLLQQAHLSILLTPPADPDQSQRQRTIQFGGSRFEQSAFLFCDTVAWLAMQRWQIDPATMQARHANLE